MHTQVNVDVYNNVVSTTFRNVAISWQGACYAVPHDTMHLMKRECLDVYVGMNFHGVLFMDLKHGEK